MNNTIPTNLNFKKGDKLVCVMAGYSTLVNDQVYEATQDTEPGNCHNPDPFIFVLGPSGKQIGAYAWRFRKAEVEVNRDS